MDDPMRGADNPSIVNCLLVNPFNAVDFASQTSGRHLIRGLYGHPLNIGIQIDQCHNVGRIMDVHFWPFWSFDPAVYRYQANNAFSFVFYRTDWEVVQDIFSWRYHVGVLLGARPQYTRLNPSAITAVS